MADREDAAVDGVELACGDEAVDGTGSEPGRGQLSPRNDAVLSSGKGSEDGEAMLTSLRSSAVS